MKNKVIFFDLYQTLLDVNLSPLDPERKSKEILDGWNIFAELIKKYGITLSGGEFLERYEKRRKQFYLNRDPKYYHHNHAHIVDQMLREEFNLHLPQDELLALIYENRKLGRGWVRLYPHAYKTLETLSKNYTLSTASHTQASFTKLELRELGIEKFFSYFVYSSDLGYRKESVEFYKRALGIVGKDAKDCVMVGDNYDVDFVVPQQLGIKTIWIRNPQTRDRYPMEKIPRESLPIEDFDKLPDLIAELFSQSR